VRILIVDDSVVFRSQIKAALEGVPHIEVVGVANNGKVALQKLAQSSVDLVTLDMEMPEMDGLTTIKEIRKARFPVKIIVFSSHTTRGSVSTLDALTSGAQDFVTKPSGDDVGYQNAADKIKNELVPKILQFLPPETIEKSRKSSNMQLNENHFIHRSNQEKKSYLKKELETFHPSVVVIGSSTGGPPALEKILSSLSLPIRIPIVIAQHMPPVFTATLAARLENSTGIKAAEAQDGEELLPNRIYVAPGNYHLSIKKIGTRSVLKLDQNPHRNSVRPAVDALFESAAEVYAHKVLGVVLTGMGEDGMLGAMAIKEKAGGVLIQDQASCVVFGMPGAVFNSGAYDYMGNLNEINIQLKKMTT
jgi:two-component system chemotaxis response regulator CheB